MGLSFRPVFSRFKQASSYHKHEEKMGFPRKRALLTKKVSLSYHFLMKMERVTTLKRHAARLLSDLRDSGEPVLITEHGKPAAYLLDVDSYEFMQHRMRILEGIARGERAILEHRTFSGAEARQRMKKWLA